MSFKQLELRTQKALQSARRAVAELELVCRQQGTALSRAALRESRLKEEVARLKLLSINQSGRLQAAQDARSPVLKTAPVISLKEDHPIERIKQIVLEVCNAPAESFTEKGRKFYGQSWPRRLAMHLCYEVYGLGSAKEIADSFHKKDHGTVCHARDSVKADISTSNRHRSQYEECRRRIDSEVKGVVAKAS